MLHPLRDNPAVDAAWAEMMQTLRGAGNLMESVVEALLSRSWPEPPNHEQLGCGPATVATQTSPQEEILVHKPTDEVHIATEVNQITHGEQSAVQTWPGQPFTVESGKFMPLRLLRYLVLHFHRCPAAFSQVLRDSALGQDLSGRGVDIVPSWANGAKVMIEGFSTDDLRCNGYDPKSLRPWHVIANVEDVPRIFESIRCLPYHQRPRPKANMSWRGLMRSRASSEAGQKMPLVLSRCATNGEPEAHGRGIAGEPVARMDQETAGSIAKAIAASFLEDHYMTSHLGPPLHVNKTFLSIDDELSSCSPRTHVTV